MTWRPGTPTPTTRAGLRLVAARRHRLGVRGGAVRRVLLLVQGVLGMLQGIVGIAEDDVLAVIGGYVFEFSTTA